MSNKEEQSLQHLYEVLANEAVMGFMTFDLESLKCVHINRMARETLEFSNETEATEILLEALIPIQTHVKFRILDEEIIKLDGLHQDILVKKNNGMCFIANLGVKNLELNGKPHLTIMFQDTTIQKKLQRDLMAKQVEIKSAYEELLDQNTKLKELDVAKNRFIALTTHELRTPLSAIVASAEILKMGLYDGDEQLKEFIEMIWDQGQHLSELINDILDFAKIQAGKMDFFICQQDITPLLEDQVEALETMAVNNEVALTFNKPDEPCLCYYDDVRLKQVIVNIINNAIKYNNKGGKVDVWIEDKEDHFWFYCEDNGKGISKEEQTKVFDEFETLGKVALHHKGTGLGMPISKRLIEGMGGSINLESEEGVGTKFWIKIPKNKVLDDSSYRERTDNYDLAAS